MTALYIGQILAPKAVLAGQGGKGGKKLSKEKRVAKEGKMLVKWKAWQRRQEKRKGWQRRQEVGKAMLPGRQRCLWAAMLPGSRRLLVSNAARQSPASWQPVFPIGVVARTEARPGMSQRCDDAAIYRANFDAKSCVGGTGWQRRQEVVKREKGGKGGKNVGKGEKGGKSCVGGQTVAKEARKEKRVAKKARKEKRVAKEARSWQISL